MEAVKTIAELKAIPFWSQFTEEQLRASIQRSKEGIEFMKARADKTGKKYSGFTAAELQVMIDQYNKILAS